jgi:hypothetical protein
MRFAGLASQVVFEDGRILPGIRKTFFPAVSLKDRLEDSFDLASDLALDSGVLAREKDREKQVSPKSAPMSMEFPGCVQADLDRR